MVVNTNRTVSIITLLEDNNEDDNIIKLLKLVSLDYYN